MRIKTGLLAFTACLGLAAACAHAQPGPISASEAMSPLCSLTVIEDGQGRHLMAQAAPGLTGRWILEAGGPAMRLEQSGDLALRSDEQSELARVSLDAPSGPAPALETLAPGQTVISGMSNDPVFATLRLISADGDPLCTAELG
ncbi:hypothetical protein [Oceanicaulis sp. MMSF_3324]|uniref:hypothetical protein n=1 Tax=Oceanicaulis sp. MMSF_3324 TaxID=3046702 RepID=UPI00273CF7D9|nr:hypothetical protein [Oceanicaulis sp. MMSF_3324]